MIQSGPMPCASDGRAVRLLLLLHGQGGKGRHKPAHGPGSGGRCGVDLVRLLVATARPVA
ncbi:hypothetical protein H663_019975 [Limnohabitans planktonicus II-D5]|uniref:Uncharacterized protein n=2 Tax=Limnohabitans planktonicus TaxID=540060 RepID=A0A2T7U899_9BURK|nr:hypothetical protein H663_019975 [Limnohabitans planktonicus II-D5]